jgi:hypothetical protein
VIGQRLDVKVSDVPIGLRRLVPFKTVSCAEQLGTDFFVLPARPCPVALGELPAFRMGGFFWDQALIALANDQSRCVTLLRHAPVYRMRNLKKFEIDHRGRTYHNAQLVHQSEIGMMKNGDVGLVFDGTTIDVEFFDKLVDVPDKPLATVNECKGIDDIPIVQL